MALSPQSEVTALVQKLLIDEPLAEKLGLAPSDLNGAAEIARAELQAGHSANALSKFARLVMIEPRHAAYFHGLAEAALAEDHPEIALQAAAFMMIDQPEDPTGYLLSAQACLALGEFEAAAEDLDDAARFAGLRADATAGAHARRLQAVLAHRRATA